MQEPATLRKFNYMAQNKGKKYTQTPDTLTLSLNGSIVAFSSFFPLFFTDSCHYFKYVLVVLSPEIKSH